MEKQMTDEEARNQLYVDGLEKNEFKGRLENIIKPVYESVKIQGFKEWTY